MAFDYKFWHEKAEKLKQRTDMVDTQDASAETKSNNGLNMSWILCLITKTLMRTIMENGGE